MDHSFLVPAAGAVRKSVVIADDHPIFLEGLERLLRPTFDVVAKAIDGQALVRAALLHRPDAVVVDYAMPQLDGLAALKEMRDAGLASKVIILTAHEDPLYAVKCLEEGADGYVLKTDSSISIEDAVSRVIGGIRWISESVATEVAALTSGEGASLAVETEASVVESLTPRQREIIRLICAGEAAKQVGAVLGVTRKTVEYHKYKLMKRLGLTTTAELIKFAVQWRLDAEESSLQG